MDVASSESLGMHTLSRGEWKKRLCHGVAQLRHVGRSGANASLRNGGTSRWHRRCVAAGMRTALLTAVVSLIALGCSSSETESSVEAPTELKSSLAREQNPSITADEKSAVVKSTTALGLQLLRATTPGQNVMTSPHSIMTALAMAEAGATDATKEEMRAAMQLGALPSTILYSALNRLDLDLAAQAAHLLSRQSGRPQADGTPSRTELPGKLAIANGVFQQRRLDVLPSYLDVLGVSFGAAVLQVDFEADANGATDSVNAWIETRTGGAIADFFAEPLDEQTRLVLTNTVLFDGAWAWPFSGSGTRDDGFTTPTGVVQTKTMYSNRTQPHAQLEGAKVVELPFRGEGQHLAVDIVLPDGDLAAYEAGLDGDTLGAALASCADDGAQVRLALPKFRLAPATATSFEDTLVQLGMKLAFDDQRATFAAMTPEGKGIEGNRLYVDDVRQRVIFDLDEYGVEASAASAVIVSEAGSAPPKPTFEMRVDRPFLVVLRDVDSGQLLFLGRVTDPTKG